MCDQRAADEAPAGHAVGDGAALVLDDASIGRDEAIAGRRPILLGLPPDPSLDLLRGEELAAEDVAPKRG